MSASEYSLGGSRAVGRFHQQPAIRLRRYVVMRMPIPFAHRQPWNCTRGTHPLFHRCIDVCTDIIKYEFICWARTFVLCKQNIITSVVSHAVISMLAATIAA